MKRYENYHKSVRNLSEDILKPSIFIGSSSESLEIAEIVKKIFETEAEVRIWNEDVFKLNQSGLESLLREINVNDFAILILTPDDVITSRGISSSAPRDNVIFEYGLFLGRLGPNRAFILCEESVKILSDFAGITMAFFKMGNNLKSSLEDACNKIRHVIHETMKRTEISLLPSTSLAIGYYENFVCKVNDALDEGKEIRIDDKPITYDSFSLKILVPDKLSDVTPGNLKKKIRNLKRITLNTKFREFPFYISGKERNLDENKLVLYDIPTTLLASKKAIEKVLKDTFYGPSKDKEKLERREIRNFEMTLKYLIKEDFGDTDEIVVEKLSKLTES